MAFGTPCISTAISEEHEHCLRDGLSLTGADGAEIPLSMSRRGTRCLPKLLIAAIGLSSSKSYVREHCIGKHRDRRWSNPLQRDAMLHRSTNSDFINIVYPLKTSSMLYDCTSSPSKQPKNDATDPARTTSSGMIVREEVFVKEQRSLLEHENRLGYVDKLQV